MRIAPMLAEPSPAPPPEPGWLHEQKFDGVRIIAVVTASRVALFTRKDHDRAAQFPEVVRALQELRQQVGQDVVLDGEIISERDAGYSGFQDVLTRITLENPFLIRLRAKLVPCVFVAFDILSLGPHPLVDRTLRERRQLLDVLLESPPDGVRLTVQCADAAELLDRARANRWEGVVSKRADARYYPGQRHSAWRKTKLKRRQEFVVAGWTLSETESRDLRALVLGLYQGGHLTYAGRVGAGFNQIELASLTKQLLPLEIPECPFAEEPDLAERDRSRAVVRWVRPELVVEVSFLEWSKRGSVRSAEFLGLRHDKRPDEVVRES